MLKNKDIHIKVTVEKFNLIKELAQHDCRKVTALIDIALDNYLVARKILTRKE